MKLVTLILISFSFVYSQRQPSTDDSTTDTTIPTVNVTIDPADLLGGNGIFNTSD